MPYCPDVFKSIYIRQVDNGKPQIGFCCQNSLFSSEDDLNQKLELKRQQYLSTEYDPQCNSCWKVEKLDGKSRRHASIQWFENNQIELDDTVKLTSLDYNCDNLCNLACISCGPMFSSRWSAEIKHYEFKDVNSYRQSNNRVQILSELDLSNLRRVYFNGGEPLLSEDHIEILSRLEFLNRLSDCEISYNTNGTHLPSARCLELWKQAKLVRVSVSIDAVEEAFEYIRYPAKWNDICNFIKFLFNLDFNVIVDITCTVGIHNIFELPDLFEWHRKFCFANPQGDLVSLNLQAAGNIGYGGKVLNLSNINHSMAALAIDTLNPYEKQFPQIKYFIESMRNTKINDDTPWLNYFEQLDNRRNLNWKKSLKKLDYAFNNSYSSGM